VPNHIMSQFTEENPGMFYLDGYTGNAAGGYYIRNGLKDFIRLLEEKGEQVVGIKYDGTYNLEILVKPKE